MDLWNRVLFAQSSQDKREAVNADTPLLFSSDAAAGTTTALPVARESATIEALASSITIAPLLAIICGYLKDVGVLFG